jgi:hypothetical protein
MRGTVIIAVVLLVVGVVWIGQGVGLIGGSFMTGEAFWVVAGAFLILDGRRAAARSAARTSSTRGR